MANMTKGVDGADGSHDSDDEFDPRIKVELESLNQSACDINRLEKEINEARNKYQHTFYECSQDLEVLRKKYGGKINKARAYYETKELSKEAQSEAMLSARKFQSANGIYLAAKETISLAEMRLQDDKAATLSPAWQEMLNHALVRVMESEQEKTKSEKDHLERAAVFSEMEKKLHILEKKHKKSIAKAKPYFDAKNELELKLQQIKQSIEDLQQAMQSSKSQYSQSLKNLEAISDGIHEARRQKLILMYPREPGVGAEEEADAGLTELPQLPSSDADLHLSYSSLTDSRYSDSDEEEDDTEEKNKDAKDNSVHHNILNSSLTKDNSDQTVRIVNVKDRKKLRKSVSLPSYVMEDSALTDCDIVEIETDTVILKMESASAAAVPNSGNDIVTVNKTCTQTGQQILDPRALCARGVAIGGGNSES